MTANEELRDAIVRHSVYLHRYSVGTVRKMVALLSRTDADIIRQILNANPNNQRRLKELLNSVRAINLKAYTALSDELTSELTDLVNYEANYQGVLMQKTLPVALVTTIPAEKTLIAAVNSRPFQGRLLKEWLTGASESAAARTRDAIRMGVVEGETVYQIAGRIRGTKALNYTDGILDISKRGVVAMVRTAINHTVSTASQKFAEANSDLIKGVQWVSTLDGKTSAVCRARDGEVYPVDKGPRPPAHIGCRSAISYVTKSWRELGIDIDEAPPSTRASMNGQVADTETYQTWLKKQDKSFQDDVLGKTKGKLFRDGGLTLDKFIDKNSNELSLTELMTKEPAAFAKIGDN